MQYSLHYINENKNNHIKRNNKNIIIIIILIDRSEPACLIIPSLIPYVAEEASGLDHGRVSMCKYTFAPFYIYIYMCIYIYNTHVGTSQKVSLRKVKGDMSAGD